MLKELLIRIQRHAVGVFTAVVSFFHKGGQFQLCDVPSASDLNLRYSLVFPCGLSRDVVVSVLTTASWLMLLCILLQEQSSTGDTQESGVGAGTVVIPSPGMSDSRLVTFLQRRKRLLTYSPPPPISHGETTDLKNKKHFRLYFQCFSSLVEIFNWIVTGFVFETTFVISSGVSVANPIAGGR